MTRMVVSMVMLCILAATVIAEDPYVYYTWNVFYGTISLLGVPEEVILINNQFSGPEINCSSNNDIIVNVFNNINEPLLFTWHGIQLRKNSWQDGTPWNNVPHSTRHQLHLEVPGEGPNRYLFLLPYHWPSESCWWYWWLESVWQVVDPNFIPRIYFIDLSFNLNLGILLHSLALKLDF